MALTSFLSQNRERLALFLIMVLAGWFYLINLGQEGYSNHYYAAAVRSMLVNPAVLIFNSFDPAGFVTVDKPPLGLWVQVASAAVFGYSGWALILPQVLAGIGSILAVYWIVSRPFGKPAGLVAAVALTVTPIMVAVARTNNLDGLLVFVLLLAVVCAIRAWKEGSLWYLLASAALIGAGFNIKMVEAFVVIPACLGIYLLCQKVTARTKFTHVAVALAVLLVVSFSWALMMDLTPVESRPYIGSTQENSVMELIFGYNGLHRLLGGGGPDGRMPGGVNESRFNPPGWNAGQDGRDAPASPGTGSEEGPMDTMPDAPPGLSDPPRGMSSEDGNRPAFSRPGSGEENTGMGNRGPGSMNDGGEPGLFRMGDTGMSGQISWLIPFGLIGLLAWLRKPSWDLFRNIGEKGVVTLAMLLWIVPELVYFSFTDGFYHTYYVVMVAPPLAALVGIGAVVMYRQFGTPGFRGWLLIPAILVTGFVQWRFMMYAPEFAGILPWIVLCGTAACAGVLLVSRLVTTPLPKQAVIGAITVGIALLFIAPALWASTPVLYPGNAALPVAGPDLVSGRSGGDPSGIPGMGNTSLTGLYSYLSTHQTGEKYLLGVGAANSGASDIIIATGAPVIALGGFSGSDPILTVDSLREMIAAGKIRFILSGRNNGSPGGGNSSISSWVSSACRVVPDSEWSPDETTSGRMNTLYDCAGTA